MSAIPVGTASAIVACSAGDSGQGSPGPTIGCYENQFACGSGECIDSTAYCNGWPDCLDGSDEAVCTCGAGMFSCADGQCVPLSSHCDGIVACTDGSDEANCPVAAGGTTGSGGVPGTGGDYIPTGGVPGTGGVYVPTGGVPGTGGLPPQGGSGGVIPQGGSGGVIPQGGSGGVIPQGGSGGETGTGGDTGTGGSTATWHGTVSSTAQAQVQSVYNSWHSTYYRDCGNGEACIVDPSEGNRCVSEGIGYGMMAAVNQEDRTTFDALWAFYRNRRNSNGVMNWSYAACTMDVWGSNGASDAELDAAMALILADQTWGGYNADATALINAIWTHEVANCGGRYELKPGDAWGGCTDQYDQRVNPSYFSPGYYRAFAAYVPAQASNWNTLLSDTYADLNTYQSSQGGLMCDWARNQNCEGGFGYEAVRWPWRIATDYVWSGDSSAQQMLQTLSNTIDSRGGITGMNYDRNSAFYGSLALAGVVRDQATFDSYVSGWLAMATDDNRYYQTTLKVLFMQLAGGEMKSPF